MRHRCSVLVEVGKGIGTNPCYTDGETEARRGADFCQILQSKVRTENRCLSFNWGFLPCIMTNSIARKCSLYCSILR
jgi:hypothetical protein